MFRLEESTLKLSHRSIRKTIAAIAITFVSITASAQTPKPLPTLREQADIQQQWLKLRLERVLPRLMRNLGWPWWRVICRDSNETRYSSHLFHQRCLPRGAEP